MIKNDRTIKSYSNEKAQWKHSSVLFAILLLVKYNLRVMNLEEMYKKFINKPKDWDRVIFSAEQVAAGGPKELVNEFDDYHIETTGQSHGVALFKSVGADGSEIYYLTPGSITRFIKYAGHACERPDKDSVICVSGSAWRDYDRFWE